jgi:hypothetical protein
LCGKDECHNCFGRTAVSFMVEIVSIPKHFGCFLLFDMVHHPEDSVLNMDYWEKLQA